MSMKVWKYFNWAKPEKVVGKPKFKLISEEEKELEMFLTDVEIHKVENGYIVSVSKEFSEEEYKKEVEKNKKAGCCVSNTRHFSLVFTTLEAVVDYLKENWKE